MFEILIILVSLLLIFVGFAIHANVEEMWDEEDIFIPFSDEDREFEQK